MKVYVVGAGEYSDWNVVGIFSTIEDAMEAAKLCGHDVVEEYELDNFECNHRGRYPYFVKMTIEGKVKKVSPDRAYQIDYVSFPVYFDEDGRKQNKVKCMRTTVFARDERHALKIVNDKRTQIIATNQWGKEGLIL